MNTATDVTALAVCITTTLAACCCDVDPRFMDSYKWSYKSPNVGYNYSCPTYNPKPKPFTLPLVVCQAGIESPHLLHARHGKTNLAAYALSVCALIWCTCT